MRRVISAWDPRFHEASETQSAGFSGHFRGLADLFLEPLRKPLLDHALIVEIAVPREPLDPAQHLGIEAQGDRRRFTHRLR